MKSLRNLQKKMNSIKKIEIEKYYQGFKVGKDKSLFSQELKDLEIHYKKNISFLDREMEWEIDDLVEKMECFTNLYRKKNELQEKLEELIEKVGEELSTVTDEDEDD